MRRKGHRNVQRRKRRTFAKSQRPHKEIVRAIDSWDYTEGKPSKLRTKEMDQRRQFTPEERKAVLSKCHNRCACCGRQLTVKTLTVDHMIPLSRGGKNEISNLAPLCESCNRMKGNMIYAPGAFYLYAQANKQLQDYKRMFSEWFDTFYKDFPLEFAPMISPKKMMYLLPHVGGRKGALKDIPRQFMIEMFRVGRDLDDEFWAVTGQMVKEIRSDTNMLAYGEYRSRPVALYAAKWEVSQKFLTSYAVLLDRDAHHVTIYIPWHDIHRTYYDLLSVFVGHLVKGLQRYAHEQIYEVSIYAKDEESLSDPYLDLIGIGRTPVRKFTADGIGLVYVVDLAFYYDNSSMWYRSAFTGSGKGAAEEKSKEIKGNIEEGRLLAEERYAAAHKKGQGISAEDALEQFSGEEDDYDERRNRENAG